MYLFLLLIFSVLTHHVWFFGKEIMTSGDWWFYFHETQRELFALPSMWIHDSLGTVNISLTSYPMFLSWGTLGLFFNYATSERLLYLFPCVLLPIFTSYVLSKYITKSELAAAVGSMVFTFNTYFMVGRTGHLTLMFGFALVPLALYYFILALEQRKNYQILIATILMSIISILEFRAFYITSGILLLYALYYLAPRIHRRISDSYISIVGRSLLPLIIPMILNMYWILAFASISYISNNPYFQRGLFGDSFLDITKAAALFHPFWTGSEPTLFKVQGIPVFFWVYPLYALLGLLTQKKNRHILFFGILAFLGILLTKQSGIPFTHVYQFLYDHFPGFNAFREASKFYLLIALGYSVLISGAIVYFEEKFKAKKLFIHIIILPILCITFLNVKPVITGEIGTLFIERHVPLTYDKLRNRILNDDAYYRTLWVPRESRWSFFRQKNPIVRLTETVKLDEKNMKEAFGSYVKTDDFKNFIMIHSIKYIIVPIVDNRNDENLFDWYGLRGIYMNALDKSPFVKKIDGENNGLAIYQNDAYFPHLYTDVKPIRPLLYKEISQAEYYIEDITLLKNTRSITFNESFHPMWEVRMYQNNNLIGTIHSKQSQNNTNFFDLSNHGELKNATKLQLIFKPQETVLVSMITSVIIAILLICATIYTFIKKI